MRLFEISTMSAMHYRGGKDELDWWSKESFAKLLKRSQPLAGTKYRYVLNKYSERGANFLSVTVLDPKALPGAEGRYDPVGELVISTRPHTWLTKAYQVETITVNHDYRGQGVAKALYWTTMNLIKVPLLAGSSQTRGGQVNWASLHSMPGILVRGYGMLEDDVFENLDQQYLDQLIGAIMESGGEFIGKLRRWGSDYHVFMFDVAEDPNRVLQNAVKRSKIETYGKGPYPFSFAEIGLIATLE
jgi:hypothetical protein